MIQTLMQMRNYLNDNKNLETLFKLICIISAVIFIREKTLFGIKFVQIMNGNYTFCAPIIFIMLFFICIFITKIETFDNTYIKYIGYAINIIGLIYILYTLNLYSEIICNDSSNSFLILPLIISTFKTPHKIFKPFIIIISYLILYIRSLFLKERQEIFYIITMIVMLLIQLNPDLNFFSVFFFWIWLGVQLMSLDYSGHLLSVYILSEQGLWLKNILVTHSNAKNVIKRHIASQALKALVIGITQMTTTGRGALIVGTFAGFSWLINEYLKRRHESNEAEKQRTYQTAESEKERSYDQAKTREQRAYDTYKREHKAWSRGWFRSKKSEPQYKGPEDSKTSC